MPSKKKTCMGRLKSSPVEKLTKDLYTILHEQQSYFSASSEDDLLFESEAPMVSVEIGHGSVLIRHPSSIARDEESEASSLSVDNKQCPTGKVYSCSGPIPAKVPDSFKSMFNSPQFKENLTYFQQFLTEGVFDISLCGGPTRTFYCHYDTFGRNPMKVNIFS